MVRQGKGRKDRMIPIGERALAWIDKYREDVRPELACGMDDGTLFLTTAGEPFAANRMTQLVRTYVEAADIGKRGSCHLLAPHHGDADARRRGRHPVHPGHARPCRAIDHADIHPGLDQDAQADPHRHPSGAAHRHGAAPGGLEGRDAAPRRSPGSIRSRCGEDEG